MTSAAAEKGMSRLSGNVLDMKFMKRTKNRIEEDKRKTEERKKQAEYMKSAGASTSEANDQSKIVKFEHRIEVLENLAFGRMSFKGFNSEVEKYMKYHERLRNGELEEDDESKEVNDEDMAAEWGAEATVGRKFLTKQQRKVNESALIDETASRPNKRHADRAEEVVFKKPRDD